MDSKVDRARESGATHGVNAKQSDPVAAVKELTGGKVERWRYSSTLRPRTRSGGFVASWTGCGHPFAGFGTRVSAEPYEVYLHEASRHTPTA
jgi:hypothetical protein